MGRELVLAAREGQLDALENLLSSNAPLVRPRMWYPPPRSPPVGLAGCKAVGCKVGTRTFESELHYVFFRSRARASKQSRAALRKPRSSRLSPWHSPSFSLLLLPPSS